MKLKTRTMEVLSEDELENIWEAALHVWARVPGRAPGRESFKQPLRDFGCEIDGDLVRFPQPVRDRVLGRISEQKAAGRPPGADRHSGQASRICHQRSGVLLL